jgi:xeroderma pigmentosum group C-complementing protein
MAPNSRKRGNAIANGDQPEQDARPPKRRTAAPNATTSVFRAIDALNPKPSEESVEKTRARAQEDDGSSDQSSESDDGPFEDVLQRKDSAGNDEDDEDEEWEDAIPAPPPARPPPAGVRDLQLTLSAPAEPAPLTAAGTGRKGPTKVERAIRMRAHRAHVLCLLWSNTVRNAWLNDAAVQATLRGALGEGIGAEVLRWRRASGLVGEEEDRPRRRAGKQRAGARGGEEEPDSREGREWGAEATRLEPGVPDVRGGDPILRLLKYLVAFWKKRFKVTAPPLRKQGYRSIRELETEMEAFAKNPRDAKRFGERVENVEELRLLAKACRGSRDVGAQLFTALLRAVGMEARLVASLQPLGFGWSQNEEAKKAKPATHTPNQGTVDAPILLDDSSELSDAPSLETDLDTEMPTPKYKTGKTLPPIYWTEVLSPITNTWFAVSTETTPTIVSSTDKTAEPFQAFEPRGATTEKAKLVICYVIAHSADGTAKDVTVRYLKRRQLPGKTKGFRLPPEKIPMYNQQGKMVKSVEFDWFRTRVMGIYARPTKKRTVADDIEDQGDLVPYQPQKDAEKKDSMPDTLQGYKNSTEYVLERHLRREEALLPKAKPVKTFTTGKGDKAKNEEVYLRSDVVSCKTVESWHKEGRELRVGEQALKLVPIRAVTLMRKLEVEQAARQTGEKPLQGLYSREQTDWIVPPPIKDGVIPKNSYGNIDIYVPSMVPVGAVHVPLRGTVRICKKLGIDYAEACTGFEFGHQMAVPIIIGVVVAEENEHLLIDAWEQEEERKRVREDEKRRKATLALWRKFVVGLRIAERIREEYGGEEEVNPFANKQVVAIPSSDDDNPENGAEGVSDSEQLGGGFLTSDTPYQATLHGTNSAQACYAIPEETSLSATREGQGSTPMQPKSLRATVRTSVVTDDDDEDSDLEANISDDSDDEEYADFDRRKSQSKGQAVGTNQKRRQSRKSATTSPYFRTEKRKR